MRRLSSQEILSALRKAASDERRAAINRVVEACDALAASRRIKIIEIERFIRTRHGAGFGPRAQTISNEKKLSIGIYHYVEARNRECTATPDVSRMSYSQMLDRTIERIADMDSRVILRDVVIQWKLAESSLARAKFVLKSFHPGLDVSGYLAGKESRPPLGVTLDEVGIDALRATMTILTDETLSRCGLILDNGLVRRKTGTCEQLLSKGTMQGLARLLDQLSS